jgi:hypothetical protein
MAKTAHKAPNAAEITKAAMDAFWATVAAAFPNAPGDFDMSDDELRSIMQPHVERWITYNAPETEAPQ